MRLFYTDITNEEMGTIKLMYQNQGLIPKVKIVEMDTNETRSNFSLLNWKSNDTYYDEVFYEKQPKCSNGCFLCVLYENPVEDDRVKNMIFFNSNNHYIEAIPNERIKKRRSRSKV